jgi:DNA-binding response OmpR family regulator
MENAWTDRAGAVGRKPKVLIVDDEPMLLDLLKAMLEDVGFAVATSTSAIALPLIVRDETPDLILMDIAMPGLLGDQAVRAMRRSSLNARIPIVLHSGIDEDALGALVERSGADGYVPKDAGPRFVIAEVERWMTERAPSEVVGEVVCVE